MLPKRRRGGGRYFSFIYGQHHTRMMIAAILRVRYVSRTMRVSFMVHSSGRTPARHSQGSSFVITPDVLIYFRLTPLCYLFGTRLIYESARTARMKAAHPAIFQRCASDAYAGDGADVFLNHEVIKVHYCTFCLSFDAHIAIDRPSAPYFVGLQTGESCEYIQCGRYRKRGRYCIPSYRHRGRILARNKTRTLNIDAVLCRSFKHLMKDP